MGSYYWTYQRAVTTTEWSALRKLANSLFAALPLYDTAGTYPTTPLVVRQAARSWLPPVIGADRIQFNASTAVECYPWGYAPARRGAHPLYAWAADDFVLTCTPAAPPPSASRARCRTQSYPYDLAVRVILLAATLAAPEWLAITSDGDLEPWYVAARLVATTTGHSCPISVTLRPAPVRSEKSSSLTSGDDFS